MEVTEAARKKIAELIEVNKEIMPEHKFFLRVTAMLDADNKLKQQVYFDYETRNEDRLLRFKEFDLRIDEESYVFLKHAKLKYHEGEGFFLDNPDSHGHSGYNII